MRAWHVIGMGWCVFAAACSGVDGDESNAKSSLENTSGDAVDEPPTPPADASCVSGAIGDGSCTSALDLKLAASDSLCAPGLVLSTYALDYGDCGQDEAAGASYSCCEPPPPSDQPDKPPPSDDPPGDDPGAGSCTEQSIDASACVPTAELESEAGVACNGAGSTLVDVKLVVDGCTEGEASSAWFVCCVATVDD